MPFNRRRFIALSAASVGITGISAIACSKNNVQAESSPLTPDTSAIPATGSAAPTASPSVGPAGFYAPPRGDIRVAIVSDLNSAYGSTDYRPEVLQGISALPEWQPDLVLCAGDMVAGQSLNLSATEIEAMWSAFDSQILDPIRSAQLPFALTVGNHDASSYQDQTGEFVYVLDRQETSRYWNGHRSDTGLTFLEAGGFPYYYSFQQNDLFVLIWDASSANIPPEQIAWAEQALSSPAAQTAHKRIVLGHLPLYAVSQRRDRAGEYLNQADQLRDLLERHNVDTYISGHHHAYYPGRAGSLNTLHAGALGSGPKSLLTTTAAPFQTLTIMDLFLQTGATTYTTYNMNTLEVVDPQSLPRQIVGPNGREIRQDLTISDFSPEERSQPYIPSEA